MSIAGVSGAGSFFQSPAARAAAQQAQAAAADDSGLTSNTPNATNSSVQSFLNYAKESPAQRMVDDWLKAHGLTEQELDKMPPDKQAAIRKEMADDIKKQIDEQVEKKTGATVSPGGLTNIVA
jgi:hypothetical protein